jgi:O-antigen ligase
MRNLSPVQTLARLRLELDRYAIFTATAVFTLLAAAVATDGLELPGGMLLLALYPAALVLVVALRPGLLVERELRGAAAWSVLVLVALLFVPMFTSSALLAAGFPFALGVAVLIAKFPAAATVLAAFTSAILGTFQAFVGFSPGPVVDLILVGIWFVLLGRIVLGRRPYNFVIWPAVVGCGFYVGVTVLDMVTADDLGVAWFGFRTTVWYMLAFFALAYAGWSRETYRRIAIGFVGVTVVVAAYATLRWVIGPAGAERTLAEFAGGGINIHPIDKHLRTVGSFQTGHALAFWMAFMAPFCLAVALWARGWKRLLAVAAIVLCVLAMIASEARGPLPGFLVGAVLVLGIYQVSRAYPGFKAGITVLALSAVAIGAGAVFVLGESDPDRLDRYANILEPEDDPTFIQRQLKWEQILPAIEERPFGHGLGTGGSGQDVVGSTVELSEINIDNSYLMIAYEQGVFVLGLFVVVVVGLLISLIVASVRTRSREAAAFGMGACGVLASVLISCYTGLYIEVVPIVSAWLIVGLGLSYFVSRRAPAAAPVPARVTERAQRWEARPAPQPALVK